MGFFSKIFGELSPEEQKQQKFLEFENSFHDKEALASAKAAWLTSRANYRGDRDGAKTAIQDLLEAISVKSDWLPAYVSLIVVYSLLNDDAEKQRIIREMPEEQKSFGSLAWTKIEALAELENSFPGITK